MSQSATLEIGSLITSDPRIHRGRPIISGTGGSITTPTSATSAFSGTSGATYTLRWTISNPPCVSSADDVVITFTPSPSTSNAGPNQTVCATSVTLAANPPAVGTGSWAILAGTGGAAANLTSPTSAFTVSRSDPLGSDGSGSCRSVGGGACVRSSGRNGSLFASGGREVPGGRFFC